MKQFNLTKLDNRGVTAAQGYKAAGINCGIKREKKDLSFVYSTLDAAAAAVFTSNQVQAAPVSLCREHLLNPVRLIAVNSGNANACTGDKGLHNAHVMASNAAAAVDTDKEKVMVCSTGVIGLQMPMNIINQGLGKIADHLSEGPKADKEAAEAILTTDKTIKLSAYRCTLPEGTLTIGGMAKGSGMICPNMATMLAFLTTDARIERALLQELFSEAVDQSFNLITVDGDTSTNDTAMILANGAAKGVEVSKNSPFFEPFKKMLSQVCQELALKIVEDGEGLTKLITLEIKGAHDYSGARKMARSVLNSPLVKTAFYGEDANWGRIIAALGYAGVTFDPGKVDIFIGSHQVAQNGAAVDFDEKEMKKVLEKRDILVTIDLKLGAARVKAWGTDLSHEYISINSSYRS